MKPTAHHQLVQGLLSATGLHPRAGYAAQLSTLAAVALLGISSPYAHAASENGRNPAASAPAAATAAAPAASTALPGNSLYQLDISLTDAASQRFALRDMAGTPVLVTMFYGDCNAACPIIIETLKRTVEALGPNAAKLRVLMVSLDPFNDSPAGLAQLVKNKQLDPQRFRLAVAKDESQTRMLAGALQIKFRQLGDGVINHTTRIALLDGSGLTKAVSTRLDTTPDAEFVKQINSLLKTVKN